MGVHLHQQRWRTLSVYRFVQISSSVRSFKYSEIQIYPAVIYATQPAQLARLDQALITAALVGKINLDTQAQN